MSIIKTLVAGVVGIFVPKRVEFDFEEVVQFLMGYLEVDSLRSAYDALKREFSNPLRPGDLGVWGSVRRNIDLVMDVTLALVQSLEKITIGGQALTSPEKLEIAAEAMDRMVRLPWYLEPFDKPLFKMLISMAVTVMNAVNWQPVGPVKTRQLKAVECEKIPLKLNSGKVSWDLY